MTPALWESWWAFFLGPGSFPEPHNSAPSHRGKGTPRSGHLQRKQEKWPQKQEKDKHQCMALSPSGHFQACRLPGLWMEKQPGAPGQQSSASSAGSLRGDSGLSGERAVTGGPAQGCLAPWEALRCFLDG